MEIDEQVLNRFRGEVIDALAALDMEFQAIRKTLHEIDRYGPTRLKAKRDEVLAMKEAIRSHYEDVISPLRRPL